MARLPVNQPYTITTGFGVPDSNAKFGRHSGIDYAVPFNRPIYAPASGQLTNVLSPTGGNMVRIFDGKYYHRLMHNSSFTRNNGQVSEGDEVARAGSTGLSTGVHSHWDVSTQKTPTSFSSFINPNVLLEEDMNVNQDQLDKICWLATGLQAKSNPNFQNNLGNPLDVVLNNFMGYTETRNLHLDAEAYRKGQTAPTKVLINGKEYILKG